MESWNLECLKQPKSQLSVVEGKQVPLPNIKHAPGEYWSSWKGRRIVCVSCCMFNGCAIVAFCVFWQSSPGVTSLLLDCSALAGGLNRSEKPLHERYFSGMCSAKRLDFGLQATCTCFLVTFSQALIQSLTARVNCRRVRPFHCCQKACHQWCISETQT